jgi:hypothetical protein
MSKIKPAIHQNEDKTEPLSEEKILRERLRKGWLLTCEAYGIDPDNPPKMDKRIFFAGTHEEHEKFDFNENKKIKERKDLDDIEKLSQ